MLRNIFSIKNFTIFLARINYRGILVVDVIDERSSFSLVLSVYLMMGVDSVVAGVVVPP